MYSYERWNNKGKNKKRYLNITLQCLKHLSTRGKKSTPSLSLVLIKNMFKLLCFSKTYFILLLLKLHLCLWAESGSSMYLKDGCLFQHLAQRRHSGNPLPSFMFLFTEACGHKMVCNLTYNLSIKNQFLCVFLISTPYYVFWTQNLLQFFVGSNSVDI